MHMLLHILMRNQSVCDNSMCLIQFLFFPSIKLRQELLVHKLRNRFDASGADKV